jgi:hypothetical protein
MRRALPGDDRERIMTMRTEDLSAEQMQEALKSFREWAKSVVIALGDEPTFTYDYDGVPGKIEALRKQVGDSDALAPSGSGSA